TAESLIQAGLHEIPDARFALDRVDCLQDGTYVALSSGHLPEALARAEAAQRALRQAPFRPALLELQNLLGLARSYSWSKRKRDALATYEQASELIRTQGLGGTRLAGEVFVRLGTMVLALGRPLEAEPFINRAIQIVGQGQPEELTSPDLLQAHTMLLLALG